MASDAKSRAAASLREAFTRSPSDKRTIPIRPTQPVLRRAWFEGAVRWVVCENDEYLNFIQFGTLTSDRKTLVWSPEHAEALSTDNLAAYSA